MSCRNPNVDGCMANDTQSYSETFSNENSNNSGYWSDSQETPKIYGKNDYLSEFLCNSCYADRQKVSVFFFKNEGSLNQFQCNFKSNYLYISIFSNFIVFQCEEYAKMYEPKIISKESIHLFTPKLFLVDWTKIKIAAKEKANLPARL